MNEHERSYTKFKLKFGKISADKLRIEKLEKDTIEDYLSWAEGYFTRRKRKEIINACKEKEYPAWRIKALEEIDKKWEEDQKHITIKDIDIFGELELNQYSPVKEPKSKSKGFFKMLRGGID